MSSVALHPDIDPMNESWYTIFIVSRCGYPGLCFSIFYKKEQEWFAKTVTNNLPILSVLCLGMFKKSRQNDSVKIDLKNYYLFQKLLIVLFLSLILEYTNR